MKKVLTIGGISLVLMTLLGVSAYAKDNGYDCFGFNNHHDYHYQECFKHNDNCLKERYHTHHHNNHHLHNNHHNCR